MGTFVFSISMMVAKILRERVIDIISETLNLIAAKYDMEMTQTREVRDCKVVDKA